MRATATKLDTKIPDEYKHIVKSATRQGVGSSLLGYHDTAGGSWATDGYRMYIDCPTAELPANVQDKIPTDADEALWPVTDSFRRWAKVIAKYDKDCHGGGIIPGSNNWLYARERADFGEVVTAAYMEKPPFANPAIGINPDFLLDAIAYSIGKKSGTIRVSTTGKQYAPWAFRANGRTVVLMPINRKS